MKTFYAFFDVLGFKEFINNNEMEYAQRMFGSSRVSYAAINFDIRRLMCLIAQSEKLA